VLIRAIPTQHVAVVIKQLGTAWSQSHRADQGNSDDLEEVEEVDEDEISRNPAVLIRAGPVGRRPNPPHDPVAIPPY
jgi:hypothetical protein